MGPSVAGLVPARLWRESRPLMSVPLGELSRDRTRAGLHGPDLLCCFDGDAVFGVCLESPLVLRDFRNVASWWYHGTFPHGFGFL